jgi:hypothetical protein
LFRHPGALGFCRCGVRGVSGFAGPTILARAFVRRVGILGMNRLACDCILLGLTAFVLGAQPAEVSLGRRTGVVLEPFSDVTGLAELRDGRVIVADRVERAYVLVDFRTGSRKTLGSNGSGPNEYQIPSGPIVWKGDTLLGFDGLNHRYVRIGQDGKMLGTIPFPTERTPELSILAPPRGVDSRGRIYWDAPIIATRPVVKRSDSANVIRFTPGGSDPAVEVKIADHGAFEHHFAYRAVPQSDAWVMGADGRIGVLSAAEYRLRWFKEGKLDETGPRIPYTPVPVTAAERDAFRSRKAAEPMPGSMRPTGGDAQLNVMGPVRAKAAWPDSLFPAYFPPFEVGGVRIAPNGDLWVKRIGSAGETTKRVDILDSSGKLRTALRLPPGRELFQVGPAGVYLLSVDGDGFQTLERYDYPGSAK